LIDDDAKERTMAKIVAAFAVTPAATNAFDKRRSKLWNFGFRS
jgi:hypothetical protein